MLLYVYLTKDMNIKRVSIGNKKSTETTRAIFTDKRDEENLMKEN